MADLIKLTRDAEAFPDSHEATVGADELAQWEANGWAVADPLDHDGDGQKGGSKPKGKKKPDAANGLTQSEIEADLTAMGVDFDPTQSADELLALRDEARAIRDA